jgi:hypothetical protein
MGGFDSQALVVQTSKESLDRYCMPRIRAPNFDSSQFSAALNIVLWSEKYKFQEWVIRKGARQFRAVMWRASSSMTRFPQLFPRLLSIFASTQKRFPHLQPNWPKVLFKAAGSLHFVKTVTIKPENLHSSEKRVFQPFNQRKQVRKPWGAIIMQLMEILCLSYAALSCSIYAAFEMVGRGPFTLWGYSRPFQIIVHSCLLIEPARRAVCF